ncbi:MAG: hypothetical protein OER96_08955 [Gammaproteobacteria bacterium]|nr:hypothetical protein [Gammaproteobacteria bacterium]
MGKTIQTILLTVVLTVTMLTTGLAHADHKKHKNKQEKHQSSQSNNLDSFARKIKKKGGRLLKFIQDESGNTKAKVLTKDGKVRYLSVDKNGD